MNPLVALYFCCVDSPFDDGQVVVYYIKEDRIKTFDSDTVSVVSNTALLTTREKSIIDLTVINHFNNKDRLTTSDFNRKAPLPRLLHFIQSEKPYFQPKILPQAFRQYMAVLPKRNNRRMIAQSGAFIVFASNQKLTANKSPKIDIDTIDVSASAKQKILIELDDLNINLGAPFPDVASASEYLSRKFSFPF